MDETLFTIIRVLESECPGPRIFPVKDRDLSTSSLVQRTYSIPVIPS